jgi:hypothetical protein
MNRLRQIHLYLGCVFAPLLAFFALSGIWHNYFLYYSRPDEHHPRVRHVLMVLSSLHTGRGLKSGETLSSPTLRFFVAAMALSLLVTMLLGIVMAFRFGRARVALLCLLAGVVIPLVLIAFAVVRA